MHYKKIAAEEAYYFVKERRKAIMPNLGFVFQLQEYEYILQSSGYLPVYEDVQSNFLVNYLRKNIPLYTEGFSDDQLIEAVNSNKFEFIIVMSFLRAKSLGQIKK